MSYSHLMRKYKLETRVALQDFIKIDSTYDASTVTEDKPFGEGVDQALKYIGRLGERFGFDVDYCNDYCTEISYGTGDRMIAIFAHADVVPATGEWKYEKFGGTISADEIGLPVESTGLVLPCGSTAIWQAK